MTDNNDPQSSESSPPGWHPTQLAYKPEETEQPVVEQPIQTPPPPVAAPVAPPPIQQPAAPLPPPPPPQIQTPPQPVLPVQPVTPVQEQTRIQSLPQAPAEPPPVTPVAPIAIATAPEVKPSSKKLPPSAFDSPHSFSRLVAPEKTKQAKQKRKISLPTPNKSIAIVAVALFLLFGVIGTYYSYQHMSKIVPPKTKFAVIPTTKPQAQEQKVLGLVEKVGKKVNDLPKDEIPSVATITELSKLKNKAFFAKAKKGDKLLIYATARKAVLFRPSTNKIIQESAVELVSKDSTASEAAQKTISDSAEPVLRIKY